MMATPPDGPTADLIRSWRPRPLRRWARRGAVALLLLLAMLSGWLHTAHFREWARDLIERFGSTALGEDLSVAGLDFQPLPFRLALRGVELHARSGPRTGTQLASVEQLSVAGLRPRWRGLSIGSVHAVEPRIDLAWEEGRLVDFADLRWRLGQRAGGGEPIEVQIGEIIVERAAGRVSLTPPGLGFAIDGLELRAQQPGPGAISGSLSVASLEVSGDGFSQALTLSEGSVDFDGRTLVLDGYRIGLPGGGIDVAASLTPGSELIGGVPTPTLGFRVRAETRLDLAVLSEAQPALPPMEGQLALDLGGRDGVGGAVFDGSLGLLGARVARQQLDDLTAAVDLHGTHLRLYELDWAHGGGRISGEVEIALSAGLPFVAELGLSGLRFEEIFDAHARRPDPHVTFGVDGSASLYGRLAPVEIDGRVDVEVHQLRVMDGPWSQAERNRVFYALEHGALAGELHIDARRISWTDVEGWAGPSYIRTSGNLFPRKERPLGLDIQLDLDPFDWATAPVVAGLGFGGRGRLRATLSGPTDTLAIFGDLELADAEMLGYPLGDVRGRMVWSTGGDLHLNELVGRIGETPYQGSVRVEFQQDAPIHARIQAGPGRLEDVTAIFLPEDLPLTGDLERLVATIDGPTRSLDGDLRLSVGASSVFGQAFDSVDADLELEEGRVVVEQGLLRVGQGGISVRGSMSEISGQADLDMHFSSYGLGLEDLSWVKEGGPVSAGLALDVALGGTIPNPALDAGITLRNLAHLERDFGTAQLKLALLDREFRLTGALPGVDQLFALARTDGLWPYTFALRLDEPIDLSYLLPGTVSGRRFELAGSLQGGGSLRDSFHDIALGIAHLELGQERHDLRNDGPLTIRYRDGAFEAEELHLVGTGTDLQLDGWVIPGGPLEARVAGETELWLLNLFGDLLVRADAEQCAVDLAVTGTTSAVDIEGSATLRDAVVQTSFFPHPARIRFARLVLDDRVVELTGFSGSLGQGDLQAGGTIQLDRRGYRPRYYDLSAACVDCRLRYPAFLPAARGDVQLSFRGQAPDQLTLGGQIRIDEMVFRDRINWQASLLSRQSLVDELLGIEDEDALFDLDIEVSTDRGVRLANNLASAALSGDIAVVGDSARPGIVGALTAIPGGRARFRGRDFELESARLVFPESDPYSYDPRFDIDLRTTVTTDQQDYEIGYNLAGTLTDTVVNSWSNPALAEVDVNSLLLFGALADDVDPLSLVLELAEESVGGSAGNRLADLLTVDQIELDTVQVDEGLAIRLSVLKRLIEEQFQVELGGYAEFGAGQTLQVGLSTEAILGQLRLLLAWQSLSQGGAGLLPDVLGDFSADLKLVFEAD